MDTLATIVKAMVPGSVLFLILTMGVGIVLLFGRPRLQSFGRRWLCALAACYWIMSTPMGADGFAAAMSSGYTPIATRAEASNATAIVVLDGGTLTFVGRGLESQIPAKPSVLRAMEAARVSRLLDNPWVIVQAGSEGQRWTQPDGSALRDELVKAGVPSNRILLDSESINTHQHAITIRKLLESHEISRFVLVTSPTHIRRAMLAFRAQGYALVPSPAPLRSEALHGWRWTNVWPRGDALELSADAFRDCLALVYYGARGWL